MERPTLTIFTPNYNHGHYVEQAIQSVLAQSRLPDQYLILDDGSTDDSRERIRPYAERHPWIEFLCVEHQGLWAGLELALARTTSGYFLSLSADDYLVPGFLEKAMAMAERHPEAGILFGRLQCCDLEGRVYWTQQLSGPLAGCDAVHLPPDRFLRDYLEQHSPINSASPATVYRAAALREVGYWRELDAWADTFACWAIGAKYGACALNVLGTTFRQGSNASMSGNWFNDPPRAMNGITRAAQLMLSPPFHDRFPRDFVLRWHAGYLDTLLQAQSDKCLRQFEAGLESLPIPPRTRRGPLFRLQRWLLPRLLRAHVRARLSLTQRFYRAAVADHAPLSPTGNRS